MSVRFMMSILGITMKNTKTKNIKVQHVSQQNWEEERKEEEKEKEDVGTNKQKEQTVYLHA